MKRRCDHLVLSCEHAGNRVPRRYARLFAGRDRVLASHRGYDPGAWRVAKELGRRFGVPVPACQTTRLLIEPNRSENHPDLFSRYTRLLPAPEKKRLIVGVYRPHRTQVKTLAAKEIRRSGLAIHVAVHTFTPVLRGERRRVGVGLLYDPARRLEAAFCRIWRQELARLAPRLRIGMNEPYHGASDALPTTLRRQWSASRYLGIELEVNQRYFRGRGRGDGATGHRVIQALADSLEIALLKFQARRSRKTHSRAS